MRNVLILLALTACKGPDISVDPIDFEDFEGLPTVSAGDDQTVDEGATVVLVGQSSDSDGSIASSEWRLLTGPEEVSLNVTADTATFTAPATKDPVTYTFRYSATDDDGFALFDDVDVVVMPINEAPTVTAGDDAEADERTQVVITGDATDDDGFIVSWAWVQTGGPPVTIANVGAPATSFRAPEVDEPTALTFSLTVADDEGDTATDEMTVTILDANDPPQVNAGADQTVNENTEVLLLGDASDLDGGISSAVWTAISGPPVVITQNGSASASFIAPEVDAETTLTLRLTATDTDGATAFDDTVILVLPYDQGPTVYAGDDYSAFELTEAELNGGADDVDGVIESYQWTQLGGVSATISDPTSPTTTVSLPDVLDETILTFRLSVTDDGGNTASDEVSVTVRPRNQPPIVDAGPTQNVRIASQVNLIGSGTDPDGSITTWQWEQTAGPTVTLSNADGPSAGFTSPLVANDVTLSFQLTAIDNEGASGSDTVDVEVRAQLYPPVADAGPDRFVDSQQLVVIEGSGTDQDGSIVSYHWEQIDGPTVELLATSEATTGLQAPETACGEVVRLRLTVTDNDGLTDTDDVGIVISGVNRPVVSTNTILDFEEDIDGVQVDGGAWELGLPVSGPNRAYSGVRAWGTNLSGNYSSNDEGVLCLPVVDLSAAADPSFAMAAWVRTGSGDALGVEVLDPDNGWTSLTETYPRRESFDASGAPGWQRLGYRDDYEIVAASLADYAGERALLRVTFRANGSYVGAGAYVDTIGFFDETDDPDNDGLPGILDEVLVHNSDPFVADTDGDGYLDGEEVVAGSSADNPAWTPETVAWTPDHMELLQAGDGGLATVGTLWEYGTPSHGASGGHTGAFAWGTDLDDNHFGEAIEDLYLPPVDLTAATDPTLSFRLHHNPGRGDITRVEVRRPNGEWEPVEATLPGYAATGPGNIRGWGNYYYLDQYRIAAVPLTDHTGRQVELRIAFRSDSSYTGPGAYIDDIGVHEETSDPDGDGLIGVRTELATASTDPFVADTDADGTSDATEVADATDPLNPAWFADADPLSTGELLDFDNSANGTATLPWLELWEMGAIRSGPNASFSGTRGWATVIDDNHYGNAEEWLFLPPLDLTNATHPILTTRIWARAGRDDGARLQVEFEGEWLDVEPVFPAYDDNVAGGHPVWNSIGYLDEYELAAFDLSAWTGRPLRARYTFTSDSSYTGAGVYLDDVGLWEEGSDPDGDGIIGVLAEAANALTDPLIADTDGDSASDGAELASGYDPLNPAFWAGATVMQPGDLLTFEESAQGVATTGRLWQRGSATSGPDRAHSGTVMWATSLTDNYFANAREFLYLPPMDLASTSEPVVGFRLHHRQSRSSDGTSFEARASVDAEWTPMVPDAPEYGGPIVGGWQAWYDLGYRNNYELIIVPLSSVDVDQTVATRLAFRSDSSYSASGAYVDDLFFADESDDFDGDGLPGIMNELATWGTDPTVADTDGDGTIDGDEVSAGTDPLNPAWYPGGPSLSAGDLLDFESDNGGLAADQDHLWEWGTISGTPDAAFSGTQVWATDLNDNFFANAREYLYLPPLNLQNTTTPYLTFKLWLDGATGDGLSIEVERGAAWFPIPPASPAFDGQDAIGQAAWQEQRGSNDAYVTVGIDLREYAGAPLRLRFAFRSDGSRSGRGAYIDDIALTD